MKNDHKPMGTKICVCLTAFCSSMAYGVQWVVSEPVSIQWHDTVIPEKRAQEEFFALEYDNKNNPAQQSKVKIHNSYMPPLGLETGISTGDVSDPFYQFEGSDDYYNFLQEFKDTSGWLAPTYNSGNQKQIESYTGFSASSSGLSIGLDGTLSMKTKIGISATYYSTKINSDNEENISIDSGLGSFYSHWSDRRYFFDTILTAGSSRADRSRVKENIFYKGDFDSYLFSANIVAGKHFKHMGWNIAPRLALNYAAVSFGNYIEVSNTNQSNKVLLDDFSVKEIGLGIKIDKSYWSKLLVRRGRYQPEFSLAGYYDISNNTNNISTQIPTGINTFIVTGPKKDRFRLEGSMGLTISSYKNFTFNTFYRFHQSKNYLSHGVSADLKYKF